LHYKGVAAEPENIINIPEGIEFFSIERNFNDLGDESHNTSNNKAVSDIQFILQEGYNTNTNVYLSKSTSIVPFDNLRLELETGYREVEINLDYPAMPKYNGRNITAFLPGKDKTYEDPGELIIIGASYDGVHMNETQSPHAMTAAPTATSLEVARMLSLTKEPLEKSIQFIFWDNEYDFMKYSNIDGSHDYSITRNIPVNMAISHKYYYFDISYPGYSKDENLNIMTAKTQVGDKSNYLMGLEMEKRLKQMDVKYQRFHNDYTTTKAMNKLSLNALSSVAVGNSSIDGVNSSIDILENINYKKMDDIGQIILDTMTMNPHIMD